MKKKLVLKPKVKNVLIKFVLIGMSLLLVWFGYNYTQKGIKDCIEAGNSQYWCERNVG